MKKTIEVEESMIPKGFRAAEAWLDREGPDAECMLLTIRLRPDFPAAVKLARAIRHSWQSPELEALADEVLAEYGVGG